MLGERDEPVMTVDRDHAGERAQAAQHVGDRGDVPVPVEVRGVALDHQEVTVTAPEGLEAMWAPSVLFA